MNCQNALHLKSTNRHHNDTGDTMENNTMNQSSQKVACPLNMDNTNIQMVQTIHTKTTHHQGDTHDTKNYIKYDTIMYITENKKEK